MDCSGSIAQLINGGNGRIGSEKVSVFKRNIGSIDGPAANTRATRHLVTILPTANYIPGRSFKNRTDTGTIGRAEA